MLRRRGSIDALDDGVGMRRAQDVAPQGAGTADVRDVAAAAGEETEVLEARDRPSNELVVHPWMVAGSAGLASGNFVDRHLAGDAAHRPLLGGRAEAARLE